MGAEFQAHGALVEVQGVGILLLGPSGIGKSECALELVMRGHRLVADDVVRVRREPDGRLVGTGPELIRHYMDDVQWGENGTEIRLCKIMGRPRIDK